MTSIDVSVSFTEPCRLPICGATVTAIGLAGCAAAAGDVAEGTCAGCDGGGGTPLAVPSPYIGVAGGATAAPALLLTLAVATLLGGGAPRK